jgi:hypothetical protein
LRRDEIISPGASPLGACFSPKSIDRQVGDTADGYISVDGSGGPDGGVTARPWLRAASELLGQLLASPGGGHCAAAKESRSILLIAGGAGQKLSGNYGGGNLGSGIVNLAGPGATGKLEKGQKVFRRTAVPSSGRIKF